MRGGLVLEALLLCLAVANVAVAEQQDFHKIATVQLASGMWPDGFTPFCQEQPDQCDPVEDVPAPVDYLKWESRLSDINLQVNSAIQYRLDIGDHFDDGPKWGDCDDYALTKRNQLLRLGFHRANLLFAFVKIHATQEKHTVLIVRTNYGPKVLDNIVGEVYDLDQMMVDWAWVQSPKYPRVWLAD